MDISKLYIQLFSIHGLIRWHSPELGRDADTGGQVNYLLELAKYLAEQEEVGQVDLFTRLISDKVVSKDYSRMIDPLESISAGNVRIVRIQCGGKKYIRKEQLWPHLDEFVDKVIKFNKLNSIQPDIFHGHYADGGYVAKTLADIFNVPLIFTGHSMGLHKKLKLNDEGFSDNEIDRQYNINHRIAVEENIIRYADNIITSTRDEIHNQYGLYNNFRECRQEKFNIVPPGIDLDSFYPYYNRILDPNSIDQSDNQANIALLNELKRFWVEPEKPFILALCRPDQRKNIDGLIEAYGKDKELQAIANLAIFAGIRKNIKEMEDNEQSVLTEMLLLMDKYDLYGKMAIPKKHDFASEVPELYRLCAEKKGVFINPALIEPFGLTLIEAAGSGLPIIATSDGGPSDIISGCSNGILIQPTKKHAIAKALKKLLINKELWDKCSKNGINNVRKLYSWRSHCRNCVRIYRESIAALPVYKPTSSKSESKGIGRKLSSLKRLIITDIDNTLVGDDAAMRDLLDIVLKHEGSLGWGVATGRSIELVLELLNEYDIPSPDIVISSVGTEIYYGADMMEDMGWSSHINRKWNPGRIKEVLSALGYLVPQESETEKKYKLSYYFEYNSEHMAQIHHLLHAARLSYNLTYSHNQFLDILPFRASKGKAVRYMSYKWEVPLSHILVCGDSGNDEDMLRGETSAVVVGNYSSELEKLRGVKKVFFSKKAYAAGIIDGLEHYRFLDSIMGMSISPLKSREKIKHGK